MPVNLSIKNVPDDVAEKLRKRAVKHHRSLQGELMAILEESLAERKVLTPAELLSEVQGMGLKAPDESATIIRKERDARSRR
jgi:plasmid stability protein